MAEHRQVVYVYKMKSHVQLGINRLKPSFTLVERNEKDQSVDISIRK